MLSFKVKSNSRSILILLLLLTSTAITQNIENLQFSQSQQAREKQRFLSSKHVSSSSGKLMSSDSSSSEKSKCQANIQRIKNQASLNWSSIANSQTVFTDSLFPTNSDSIYSKSSITDSNYDQLSSQISWQRARSKLKNATIFNANVQTNLQKVLPYDIDSSIDTRDQYYLASLSALQDSQVQSIIQTPTYNKAGIFAANVYIKGIKTTVIVDDYFPFISKKLAFAQQSGTALWGPFMEKIWAKVTGNYDSTTSNYLDGDPNQAFEFLQGLPTEYYIINSFDDSEDYSQSFTQNYNSTEVDQIDQRISLSENVIHQRDSTISNLDSFIKQSLDNGFNLVSSITSYNYDTYTSETKFILILGIYHIQNQYAYLYGYSTDTILLMYNYDGTDLQFDAWGENYDWTTNEQAQIPFYQNNSNDGIFYISINDFQDTFDTLYVAHNHNGFKQSYFEVLNDNGTAKMFTLQVTTPGTYYFGVQYYDPRMYPQDCRIDRTTGQFSLYTSTGSKMTQQYTSDYVGFNYVQFDYLVAGTYYLVAQNQYTSVDVNDFTVRAYGVDSVAIAQVNNASQTAFIQSIIQNLVNNYGSFFDGDLEYNDETLFQVNKGSNGVISFFQVINSYRQSLLLTFNFYIGTASTVISSPNGFCGRANSSKFGNVIQCTCNMQAPEFSYSSASSSSQQQQNNQQSQCAFGWAGDSTTYSYSYN